VRRGNRATGLLIHTRRPAGYRKRQGAAPPPAWQIPAVWL